MEKLNRRQQIKILLAIKDLSYVEIAEGLGVSQSSVYMTLNKLSPGKNIRGRIAERLGMSEEELFGGNLDVLKTRESQIA